MGQVQQQNFARGRVLFRLFHMPLAGFESRLDGFMLAVWIFLGGELR
jgi:hypothetical protein